MGTLSAFAVLDPRRGEIEDPAVSGLVLAMGSTPRVENVEGVPGSEVAC